MVAFRFLYLGLLIGTTFGLPVYPRSQTYDVVDIASREPGSSQSGGHGNAAKNPQSFANSQGQPPGPLGGKKIRDSTQTPPQAGSDGRVQPNKGGNGVPTHPSPPGDSGKPADQSKSQNDGGGKPSARRLGGSDNGYGPPKPPGRDTNDNEFRDKVFSDADYVNAGLRPPSRPSSPSSPSSPSNSSRPRSDLKSSVPSEDPDGDLAGGFR